MVVFGGGTAGGASLFDDVTALSLPATGPPTWSASFTLSGTPPSGAPEPRIHPTAVFDGAARRMVVFGGFNGAVALQDAWELDLSVPAPTAWTPLTPAAPPSPRYGHVAEWDSVNQQMVVFGGADDFGFPDDQVWTLTLQGTPTWRPWGPAPTPGPRYLGVSIFDPVTVRMIVFAGVVDDILTTTPETWALGL